MPRAEVTWNGIAKSYRVGTEVFQQNRSRTEDWSEDLLKYLKATKGFSVVEKPAAKKPEAKAEAAPAKEPEPTVTTLASTDEEDKPSRSSGPSRARRRSSS